MKKLILFLALLLPALAFGQTGITTITASKINNAGTQPLTGQWCATPAVPFVAYGGGNVPATQVCYTVTNGALQSGAVLYDVSLANPANVCYKIVLKNSFGQTIQEYPCMQPSGPVYSFDNFVQANPPFSATSFTIQPTLSFLGTWSSTQGYNPNNVVTYLGSSYVALLPNTDVTPVAGATWALLANGGGGSMTWPATVGVAYYAGSNAWGISYQVGTAANDLVQLNSSGYLPALNASLLTDYPYGSLTGTPTIPTSANWPNPVTCPTNEWVDALTNGSAATCLQIAFSNLSGIATAAQIPTTLNSTSFPTVTATTSMVTPSFTLNGGTAMTSQSSATSQIVTCATGGTGTEVCDASGAWVANGSGGPGTGTVDATAYWATTSTLGSVNSPTANGNYIYGYNVTAGTAVAPTATLTGLTTRLVNGTTATDTILYSDNESQVEYDTSVAVAVTLPTATTMGNPHFFSLIDNFTTGAGEVVTVTPTTWTVNGATSFAIQPGQGCTLSVDPASTTNWLMNCGPANTPVVANEFVASYSATSGQFTLTQPSFANLSGTATAAQIPGTLNATTVPNLTDTALTAANDCVLVGTGGLLTEGACSGTTGATIPSVQQAAYTYAADTGTANAYAVALSPAPTIVAGSVVRFKALNSNTGASTLAVNGGTATALDTQAVAALPSGAILAGGLYEAEYDGTEYQLLTSSASGGSAAGAIIQNPTATATNTVAPTGTSVVPLTLNAPSGGTTDVLDVENNGTKNFYVDSNGFVHVGGTYLFSQNLESTSDTSLILNAGGVGEYGRLVVFENYNGASVTTGNAVAYNATGDTVTNCGLSCTNAIGVWSGAQVQTRGNLSVNLDGTYTLTAGERLCTSAVTAGEFTPVAGSCPVGTRIGFVDQNATSATTASAYLKFGGSGLTGTTGTITGTALSSSCDSGTVTVTGAIVGTPVSVSSTTGVDVGGSFYLRASVTAANTVTVYICGTGTPASLAYNVKVE
jgi:hypothetical protein